MKKLLMIFSLIVLLSLLSNFVLASDIAYVVKNPSNPDKNIINAIEDLGYTYELIDDNNILTTNFNNYEMILVWDELLSNSGSIPITQKKSLVGNTYYVDDWKLADYVGSSVSTSYLKGRIKIINMITKGLVSPVQLYKDSGVSLYNLPYPYKRAPGLKNVVSTDNYHEYPVIGIINSGGGLYGGGTANARTAFFGITETDSWTPQSEQLFKNSLEWIMIGEDADGDGFHSDEDCDDTNPDINPDADEIPYNGIDEDCDGFDLVDVDGDGYDWVGVGGDDCNDSDASINPGSEDVYKNCANDAPIIQPIGKISVFEGEVIKIIVDAIDPEDDELNYKINDTEFVQDDNVFSWQTEFNDYGDYVFKITVDDGVLESEIEVNVEVKNTNQAPICDTIPDLEWLEDTTAELNLNDYCYDPDGEVLGFAFHNTSEDTHISLDSLENGIAGFSSEQDWFGTDWIIFKVGDGKSEILTNTINLIVIHNNDAPIFSGQIDNIIWDEDTNLNDYLDLNDYFSDIDSELVFGVTGNHFVEVIINQETGLVGFSPQENWFGTENVVFLASDSEFMVYSNAITLTVLDMNEPPEFGEMNCLTEILEDTAYNCELNASDFENDALSFDIVSEDNLDCSIDGSELNYIGYENYFGDASCLIRVSDQEGYNDFLLEVDINNVNDAPHISGFSPQENPKLIENTDQLFSIVVSDVEEQTINVSWFLDNINQGISTLSYLFNQEKGEYNLRAEISDGEAEDSHEWAVFVGEESDFACSELNGFVCLENQFCPGDLWGVYDSESCCKVQCLKSPPKFSDAKRCSAGNLSNNIEVEIEDPDSEDDFKPGETITVQINVDNNLDDDYKFDVDVYLYDISNDDKIEKQDDTLKVKEGEDEDIEFIFTVEEDIKDEHDYAIFVRVNEEDDLYCQEDYTEINIEREKYETLVSDLTLNPETAICGDYVDAEVSIKSIGQKDDDVTIVLENPELGLKQETEEFEIESYDGDNEATRIFNFKIPDDAEAGTYNIKGKVLYDSGDEENFMIKPLVLEDCKQKEQETQQTETISLGEKKQEAKEVEVKDNRKIILFVGIAIFTITVLIWLIYLLSLIG